MEEFLRRMNLPEDARRQIQTGSHPAQEAVRDILRRAPELESVYAGRGWDDGLFAGFLRDLESKLREYHAVHGVWGTDAESWYRRFFDFRIFALGRLEFEPSHWDLADQPPHVRSGDPILKCHIPSTGPCPRDAALDSFRRAYDFFGQKRDTVVQCKSWLLYPPHYPLFPEGGNLRAFQDLFQIAEAHERGERDLWRIFGGDWHDPVRRPRDTALRRSFARWLEEGHVMGTGFGYLVLRDGAPVFPESRGISSSMFTKFRKKD